MKITQADAERALRALIPSVRHLELRPAGSWWVADARYGMAMTLYAVAPSLDDLVAEVRRLCPSS